MRNATGGLRVFRCSSPGRPRLGPQHNLPGCMVAFLSAQLVNHKIQSGTVGFQP